MAHITNAIFCVHVCRFTVLKNPLRTKGPEYSAEIVKCCVALHNLCGNFQLNDDFDVDLEENEHGEENAPEDANNNLQPQDLGRRQRLLQQFIA